MHVTVQIIMQDGDLGRASSLSYSGIIMKGYVLFELCTCTGIIYICGTYTCICTCTCTYLGVGGW